MKSQGDAQRFAPFWKQWNAVITINVQKRKDPRGGVYYIPSSYLYYPPNGLINNNLPHPLAQTPNVIPPFFDDVKSSTANVSD